MRFPKISFDVGCYLLIGLAIVYGSLIAFYQSPGDKFRKERRQLELEFYREAINFFKDGCPVP